jgi:hypothetical protein
MVVMAGWIRDRNHTIFAMAEADGLVDDRSDLFGEKDGYRERGQEK